MSATANPDLAGNVAVVTGGASGIGAETARRLIALGAQVVVADISFDAAEDLAGELGEDAHAVRADVTSPEDTAAMVRSAVQRFGRLDLAVNSAGVGMSGFADVADTELEVWRRITAIDLDGVFFSMRAELGAMQDHGGAVVNVASVMGAVAWPGASPYVAAKHAVVGLTKTAAVEYATRGVRVNAVGPGFVDTPLLRHHGDDGKAAIADLHPVGRLATAAEVAAAVVFLLSPGASFVTGTYLPVDGGYLSR